MKSINEYLLSKKNNKVIIDPEPYCKRETIVEWLKELGVKNYVKYNGDIHLPCKGELMCETGPDDYTRSDQYWVKLIGVPKETSKYNAYQSVCLKPRDKSSFRNISGTYIEIEFEKAVELIHQMIADPNKVL